MKKYFCDACGSQTAYDENITITTEEFGAETYYPTKEFIVCKDCIKNKSLPLLSSNLIEQNKIFPSNIYSIKIDFLKWNYS